jgi:hypothetical protein
MHHHLQAFEALHISNVYGRVVFSVITRGQTVPLAWSTLNVLTMTQVSSRHPIIRWGIRNEHSPFSTPLPIPQLVLPPSGASSLHVRQAGDTSELLCWHWQGGDAQPHKHEWEHRERLSQRALRAVGRLTAHAARWRHFQRRRPARCEAQPYSIT